MWSRNTERGFRRIAPAILVVCALTGCAEPDFYFDRRDTISLHAGDAVASNIVVQSVDPWPRVAGNRNIPGNPDRMQAAGERYRTGRVIEPRGLSTSSVEFEPSGGGAGAPAGAPQ
jgi:hypothetical protein